MTLLDEAQGLLEDAVAVRRRIHRHPEIGLQLPETQKVILDVLEGLPLEVQPGSRLTSVTSTLDGGHPGPTILLRGDMDALPMPEDTGLDFASEVEGAMHACGHDTHVAMLLQATRLLADPRDALHGRVLFMFQPGEEGYHGARVMIEEGLLDGDIPPSAAFAIHIISHLAAGHVYTRARTSSGLFGQAPDLREGTGRARLGSVSGPGSGPRCLRSRPGPADNGHAQVQRVRSDSRYHRQHPHGFDRQRHSRGK